MISLWLPRFATDRLRLRQRAERPSFPSPSAGKGIRKDASDEEHPLVTTVVMGGRSLVSAVDSLAAASGIAPGMPLADARALAPDLVTRAADRDGDAAALARLADWCGRYTPLVAVEAMPVGEGPDIGPGLWLDITGCGHLFGGEAALMADLLGRLRRFGYTAQAGLADTPGAAWAAARFMEEAGGDGAVVAPGAARAALAPLPVTALRLVPAAAEGLHRLGLRQVGELYPLPRATLARRFGDHVGLRLDQALGRMPEPISPHHPTASHIARVVFAEPVLHREGLAAGLERLLGWLCRDLEAAQLGARRLVLALYRVDGSLRRAAIGTSLPSRDPAALARLYAEHLDRLDPGFGVEVMTLEAVATEPLGALQLALGCDAQLHPARGEGGERISLPHTPSPCERRKGDGTAPETVEIAQLLDRLGNRLGFDRLTRLAARESHVPERAVTRVPITREVPSRPWPIARPRPLRLFDRPEPVQAMALIPDHPPTLFRHGAALHRVARAEGPERILLEWWQESAEVGPDRNGARARDYFRVEDTEGRRYWLYREPDPADAAPRWFLHGRFA